MIVDSSRKRVLCYGDSNTWGRDPVLLVRYPVETRYTGVLQQLLGETYDVIEEGLGGRTVNQEDATKVGKNGRTYLTPCLESHVPIDILILMLGTNDLKSQFSSTPHSIANGMAELISDTHAVFDKNSTKRPRIIVISPVHIDATNPEFIRIYGHAYNSDCGERSTLLSAPLRTMCAQQAVEFLDAQEFAKAGQDGLHLDANSHKLLAQKLAEVITAQTYYLN